MHPSKEVSMISINMYSLGGDRWRAQIEFELLDNVNLKVTIDSTFENETHVYYYTWENDEKEDGGFFIKYIYFSCW